MRLRFAALVVAVTATAAATAAQTAGTPAAGTQATAAQTVVSGTVTDRATGDALVGATVAAPDAGRGTTTDSLGRYRLVLPAGTVRLVVRYVGYAARSVTIAATQTLDVALDADAALGEVVVSDGDAGRPEESARMGTVALSGRDVRALPAFLGETDVLRAVQLLPGVRSGQEGTTGLYVRGGSPDQTLILLDGVPVYNPSHLFGFLSTFNGDAVTGVELTKGAYPARYGGRLGAVLDVRLRDGDLEQHRVQGQVGLLSTRVLAEGPVVPGRASFLVSGRRTYLNVLAGPFIDRANAKAAARGDAQIVPRVSFYDLNARLSWRVTDRDRLALSLYRGGDDFGFESVDPVEACDAATGCRPTGATDVYGGGLDWGNQIGSLRYTRAVSSRVFAALAVTASDYALNVALDVEEDRGGSDGRTARARYRSAIRDVGTRLDVDVAAGRGHTVRVGAAATVRRFTPGALSLVGAEASTGAAIDTLLGVGRTVAFEAVAYAEDDVRVGRLSLGLGVRAAYYTTGRFRYPAVEPRASAAFRVTDRLAVKASAAATQQPVHLLTTGAGVGLPADLWVPADSVGPERGWQAAVGLAGSLPGGRTTWTLEAYRREMRGLVAYRDGAGFTSAAADWQDLVVTGEGRSIGLEAFVQHRTDRLTAWLGYTLARSDRRFDALDGGARFPYRYDRRHDLSAVALLRVSRRFDVSAAVVYGTGDAISLPTATYDATALDIASVDYWVGSEAGSRTVTAYGPRNRYRLPATARMDLGATLFFRRGARPHALALNVYNATNRKTPFVTTYDTRVNPATGTGRQQLVGVALFPVLPTLSYQFAF